MEENNAVINQDIKKLERISLKAGYREGKSDGRETNFQSSFDLGYAEGFKQGFSLGKYKGVLTAQRKHKKEENLPPDSLMENTSQGNCIICKDNELTKKLSLK